MATKDRATGPIPREEFAKLASAPYGEAEKVIRRYDPLWGRKEGEKIKWKVTFSRTVRETGHATVEAENQKEAEALGDAIPDSKINWDYGGEGDIDSMEVTPL
jgi:hypothetical protein